MIPDALDAHLAGVGDLFAHLWAVVSPHVGVLTAAPWTLEGIAEYEHLVEAFRTWPGGDVPPDVARYLRGQAVAFATTVPAVHGPRRAFMAMLAVDEIAKAVHPRPGGAVGGAVIATPPEPFLAMRERRWMDGVFGRSSDGALATAPKGPLLMGDDDDHGASGDRLDIHFANLTVFETRVGHFTVNLRAVAPSRFALRPPAAAPPSVGTAAIARGADDLAFTSAARDGQCFLDVRPSDPGALAVRTADACLRLLDDGAELVALPELCVPHAAVEETRRRLQTAPTRDASVVLVMGSGLSDATCPATGKRYNESVILAADGQVLWRQRKCNHFNMSERVMDDCRVPRAGGRPHAEDVASGATLEVRDLPGIGRLAVLICEDLEQDWPGDGAARGLRFDWIVAPVLDTPLGVHRWTHTRASELSRRHGSRVVVSCSSTLDARRTAPLGDDGACALLLDHAAGRRSLLVLGRQLGGPGGAAVTPWTPELWEQYGTYHVVTA